MPEPTQMLVNGIAIGLEIAGFCVMLIQTRLAEKKGGSFTSGYRDKKTGKMPENLTFINDFKQYMIGIGLVIAGLVFQIVAMFV